MTQKVSLMRLRTNIPKKTLATRERGSQDDLVNLRFWLDSGSSELDWDAPMIQLWLWYDLSWVHLLTLGRLPLHPYFGDVNTQWFLIRHENRDLKCQPDLGSSGWYWLGSEAEMVDLVGSMDDNGVLLGSNMRGAGKKKETHEGREGCIRYAWLDRSSGHQLKHISICKSSSPVDLSAQGQEYRRSPPEGIVFT